MLEIYHRDGGELLTLPTYICLRLSQLNPRLTGVFHNDGQVGGTFAPPPQTSGTSELVVEVQKHSIDPEMHRGKTMLLISGLPMTSQVSLVKMFDDL